jgi:hypothetical protein
VTNIRELVYLNFKNWSPSGRTIDKSHKNIKQFNLHIESLTLAHLQARIDIIYIAFLTSMNNIKKIIGFSSIAGIFLIALALAILFATTTNSVMAQSLTTDASNAIGNISAPQPANQTAERGENVSIALNKTANQTASEVVQNMSNAVGNANKSSNQTVTAPASNATGAMNKTGPSKNRSNLSGNTSLIGSAQQLNNVLGNNSQILANNTSIGNFNMSLGQKMSAESNATRNQTGNMSGAVNNVTQSANSTMSAVGKNLTDASGSLLNKTGEVAKKIIGGAADVVGNITGEIKKGIEAK